MKKFTTREIAEYVAVQIEEGVDMELLGRKLAALLVTCNRSRDISMLMRLVDAYMEEKGHAQIRISSTAKVGNGTKQKLAELFGATRPHFIEEINKELIGGIRAECGERLLDMSVKTKLERFRQVVAG